MTNAATAPASFAACTYSPVAAYDPAVRYVCLRPQGSMAGSTGTPTSFTLEERLCQLEGAKHCILLPSGLAALAQVNIAFLKTGDELLLPDNAYGPLKTLAEGELSAWGIRHQFYDPMNPADLAQRITAADALANVSSSTQSA